MSFAVPKPQERSDLIAFLRIHVNAASSSH
jgi:cytochrome c2